MSSHKAKQAKLVLLANIESTFSNTFNDRSAMLRSDEWLATAQMCSTSSGIALENAETLELMREIRMMRFDGAVEMVRAHLLTLETRSNTSNFARAQAHMGVSTTLCMRYNHRVATAGSLTGVDAARIVQDLYDALISAWNALVLYKSAAGSEMRIGAVNQMYFLLRLLTTLPDTSAFVVAWLKEVEEAEVFCDNIRRSTASTEGLVSLLEKRGSISGQQYRLLYHNAAEACIQLKDYGQAWLWVQKGKARALGDVFGVRALIPESILHAIRDDEAAFKLYENERSQSELAVTAGPLEYVDARRKAEANRAEMREHPLLAKVLELREGAFQVDLSQSEFNKVVPRELARSIKYVDWYIPREREDEQNSIVLLVRDLNGSTCSRTLDISAEKVETWTARVLDFPREAEAPLGAADAAARLRELDQLVKGLEELTQADDLLVLSPSGPMNRIPLHALRVAGQPLFERHPLVYSSSAAVFRQCLVRASHQGSKSVADPSKTMSRHRASLLAVYDEPTESGAIERAEIYKHASSLAFDFPFEIHTGSDVNKTSFQSAAYNDQWVHYHGHAVFNKTDVLQSGLVLAQTAHNESTPDSDDPQEPSIMTVAELFGIDMVDNAPHFTIIACDSGSQDVAPGDEPLGLIPALLYAGATSAVGTLWPVDSQTGRKFSEIFHRELKTQLDAQQGKPKPYFLDLASALRSTMRILRKSEDGTSVDTRRPLHWAPWVLQGCWFHVVN